MNILDIPIVQVALAVVISWALFAILISLIQECFAQILAERGRFMKNYLLKQLKDQPNGINWATLIYQHGAVDLLIREPNKPTNDINPTLFAEVLIEVIGESQIAQFKKIPTRFNDPTLASFKSAIETLQQSDVLAFLKLAMKNAELKYSTAGATDDKLIYQALVSQIECWYQQLMERLNLWYKKRMRQKLFIFGLIVSILINVDSIQLFNFYRLHPESATIVTRYYENYVIDTARQREDPRTLLIKEGRSLDSLAKAADLPVGFDYNVFNHSRNQIGWWTWKVVGLILTGFAASFGAPFWFDVLRKAYSKKI